MIFQFSDGEFSEPIANITVMWKKINSFIVIIDHFTVVCSVTWPLNGNEAEGDLVLIQTSLLFLCKSSCFNAN